MRKLLLFLIVSIIYSQSYAFGQTSQADSLLVVWNDPTQADSNRMQAYSDYLWNGYLFSKPDSAAILAEALHIYAKKRKYPKASALGYNLQGIANAIQGNYPQALEYYKKSLAIQEELGNEQGIAANLGNIGNIYKDQSDYPRALEYYKKSLAIQEKIRLPDGQVGDKKGIANSLGNIGNIYDFQANYPRALEYYEKSLAIFEKIRDKSGIANSLSNIGNIYDYQANYPRALEYYEKSLPIFEEIGDKGGIANSLGNIGNIYNKQADYPRALKCYEKSLAIQEEIGDKQGIAGSLNNIGLIYKDQADYPHALEYYEKSLAIREEFGDIQGIANSLINIGMLYQKQGKNTLALSYCQKGLALSEEIDALDRQQRACSCLYDAYKDMGNNKKALEYFEFMIVARDSVFNEENTKKLVQIDMQYEFDRKEAAAKAEQDKKDALALQELKRQKLVRNGFIGGFAVVLLFAGVFFNQRNKIGKEKERSEDLLLNILPYEVAEELKVKGTAEAVQIDQVTVLFTDFKGFTALSEQLTPKDLVKDLHECFSAFDNICEKYGIEKIKTIGDAYMAAGGLPTPNATHAQDVVKAALEMAEVVENGKAAKIAADLPYFEIRVGIHTGPVVAGIVGVKKFSYDIWGDTVNTASRLESSGEVNKINLSQSTYELVKDKPDFTFERRGKIAAKGKGDIEMYFVALKNNK